VRWEHPERGLISPGEFIPVAEESGLIVALGTHVLRESCAQLALWRERLEAPPSYVSVNVAGPQLERNDFVDVVAATLEETGLEPGALVLEVTESALIRDTDGSARRLKALRALGVRLAIDDFGTGYSSLSYLRRFPMDVLKIDKSFIDGLAGDDGHAPLVDAMIRMASSLSLSVVAEGIEEESQVAALSALRCELGQGYLFARPQSADELERTLAGAAAR
jgi:EAL domain-containing protein (putative c-di-GMP-specific phosphodiesterase class I)